MAIIRKKYIGLLGGSFDPAHKGHLSISKIAIKKLKLKKVYWVITKKNPFKNETLYSLEERIKYAKNISRSQKKIQTVYVDNTIKSSRIIDVVNYFIKKNFYLSLFKINLIILEKLEIMKIILGGYTSLNYPKKKQL